MGGGILVLLALAALAMSSKKKGEEEFEFDMDAARRDLAPLGKRGPAVEELLNLDPDEAAEVAAAIAAQREPPAATTAVRRPPPAAPVKPSSPLASAVASQPRTSGSSSRAEEARKLAQAAAASVEAKKYGYDRRLMQSFQRAAGILADGLYGGGTAGAVRHFLGTAPRPLFKPMMVAAYRPPWR